MTQPGDNRPTVSARARTREDKAGDPLDGLVNLFDLGIVLAVAFLLAALSSINIKPSALEQNAKSEQTAPADAVIKNQDQKSGTIKLQPGQVVVGQGKEVGTVYQLSDGRTVIVRKPGAASQDPTPNTATTGTQTPGATAPNTATP